MPPISAATDPVCPPYDGSELALGIGAKRADADPVPPPRDGRKISKDYSAERHIQDLNASEC